MDYPSQFLQLGRRQLALIQEFEILKDLHWQTQASKWALRFKIKCETPDNDFIPKETNWYAVISSSYPLGEIKIYPDQQGGITNTFEHQEVNTPSAKYPWRMGHICISTPLIKWGRSGYREEPTDAESKLAWHILRTIEWIRAAAEGKLSSKGDHFEMPANTNSPDALVGFDEDELRFKEWEMTSMQSGLIKLVQLPGHRAVFTIKQFESGKEKVEYEWGSHIQGLSGEMLEGIFIRLKEVPINPPWQLPSTWNDLYTAGLRQGLDIKKLLEDTFVKYGKRSIRFLAIGFPVSEKIGDPPLVHHWLVCGLSEIKASAGFRNGKGLIVHSAKVLFAASEKISWLEAENWNIKQITARGLVDPEIRKQKILLIGAGAVGSEIAELLIRLGCGDMTIVDDDVVRIGNFSRHSLTMSDIVNYKAEQLAVRLNAIFPYVRVGFVNKKIGKIVRDEIEFLKKHDLIIDATANDEVIHAVSDKIDLGRTFISISTGINCSRLFCYLHKNICGENLETDFHAKLAPWLLKERIENPGLELKREGIGCWHPVFPARIDDIHMLVSAAVKIIESGLLKDSFSGLTIIEKKMTNNVFNGIDIICENTNE